MAFKENLAAFIGSRKGRITLITTGVIIGIAVISMAVFAYVGQMNRSTCEIDCIDSVSTGDVVDRPAATPTPTPTPQTVAAYLDGVPVAPGKENLHPLGVMIENHPDARPQSGLGQASLVYEAIAEGGITRFLAIFRDPSLPIKVGPIRSARTYFVNFASELNAFYAHVGGNMDALDQIRNQGGVLDLDQFAVGSPVYQREPRAGIATEHTMYSSTDKLWNYAIDKKRWSQTGDYLPWKFQEDPPTTNRPAAHAVEVDFSSTLTYRVGWTYSPDTNSYSRSMAGAPHKDAGTGSVISAKNIVLQTVDRRTTTTRIGENGWIYTTTGSGKAVIIQNGIALVGTWKKEDNSRTRFFANDGKEVAFVQGPTWIEIIHPDTRVQY